MLELSDEDCVNYIYIDVTDDMNLIFGHHGNGQDRQLQVRNFWLNNFEATYAFTISKEKTSSSKATFAAYQNGNKITSRLLDAPFSIGNSVNNLVGGSECRKRTVEKAHSDMVWFGMWQRELKLSEISSFISE